jgi:hypothetical protein
MTQRRFVAAAACGFAMFFAVDWWLYSDLGFLRMFGQGTQEGQIVSKVARARRMAEAADIIAFGSSYVRSGISGEPFLDRGLLLWNFGISGGGPLTSYYALKAAASAIAARDVKPVLLLELRAEAIAKNQGTAWAEYPQYLGLVRTRRERLGDQLFLFRFFREMGMTSQFVSSVVVPSGIYRSEMVPIFEHAQQLDGFFYGMEDVSGYSPLYTVAAPVGRDVSTEVAPPLPASRWLNGKLWAIRRFLQLASDLGCPVVLWSSPSERPTASSALYDGLASELRAEFPGVRLLRTNEYPLATDDFEEGAHLNIRGSDKVARFLVDRLGLSGHDLGARVRYAFDVYSLEPVESWTLGSAATGGPRSSIVLDGSASSEHPDVAVSPRIQVTPGRECVLEVRTALRRGRLGIFIWWRNPATRQLEQVQVVTDPGVRAFGDHSRTFVRAVPRSDVVWIQIRDDGAVNGYATATGTVEPLRFWSNRL